MKRYWEQLKPQERRWAVGIGVVVFLMLNWFFVWPHRHDWGQDAARMRSALATNQLYRTEIGHKEEYVRKLRELQSDGSEVLPEDQAIDFIHFYSSREVAHKITPLNNGPLVTRTNEFFVEQQMGISVQSDETNLVNFLYSLSEGNSMMRVRAMSLHPDPSRQQLNASLTLVASYQKKTPVRSTTGAPARPASTASVAPSSPAPVKPAATLAKAPQPAVSPPAVPGSRPPGFFPRTPDSAAQPAPSSANAGNSAASSAGQTNKIAGAFARPNALKKPVTNAQ